MKEKILALFMTAHLIGNSNTTTLWYFLMSVPAMTLSSGKHTISIQHKPPREAKERTTHFYILSWSSTSYPISANLNWQLYLLRRKTMAAAINWTLHERKDPSTPVQEWHSHSKHSEGQNQLTTAPGVSLAVIICL